MKTDRFARDVLALSVGQEVEWKPKGGVWFSLHTDDPTASGSQSTNEVVYPGYQRVFVAFDQFGGDIFENLVNVQWPRAAHEMQGEVQAPYIGVGMYGAGDGYLARIMAARPVIRIVAHTIPLVEAREIQMTEE